MNIQQKKNPTSHREYRDVVLWVCVGFIFLFAFFKFFLHQDINCGSAKDIGRDFIFYVLTGSAKAYQFATKEVGGKIKESAVLDKGLKKEDIKVVLSVESKKYYRAAYEVKGIDKVYLVYLYKTPYGWKVYNFLEIRKMKNKDGDG